MDPGIDVKIRTLEGVTPKRLFGMDGYTVGGKIFAGWWRGHLVLKLPKQARDRALSTPNAHAFDPRGGRPTKEWVVLPDTDQTTLSELIATAHAYVASLSETP
ncbi:MAG: TfoX/Sxy family protein [Candidatus Geothermarchaeales archaeon]